MPTKTTVAALVESDFADAVGFFAKVEKMTISSFIKASLKRRSAALYKDALQELEKNQQSIGLMRTALDSGGWKILAAENPDIYPSTAEGWKELIAKNEASIGTVIADIEEMNKRLSVMELVY